MRSALPLIAAALLLGLGTSALADATPQADAMLDIWNRDYSEEDVSASAPVEQDADRSAPDYDLRSYVSPRYARPQGGSLTPHIDRVLNRAAQPLVTFDSDPTKPRQRPGTSLGAKGDGSIQGDENGNGKGHHYGHRGGRGDDPSPAPEPGTIALFGAAAGLAGLRKRLGRRG